MIDFMLDDSLNQAVESDQLSDLISVNHFLNLIDNQIEFLNPINSMIEEVIVNQVNSLQLKIHKRLK